MSSTEDNNSSNSTQSLKKLQRKKFSDEFEQLLNVEISKTLWVTVHKSKSLPQVHETMFVDIRRKKEGNWNGKKIYIPTQQGLFLKYIEYENLKANFELFLAGHEKHFEVSYSSKRTLIGKADGGTNLEVTLKTEYKESALTLQRSEIEKLLSDSIAEGIASAMCQAIYD